ncbi:hypothetical protein [Microvirga thermotolerans]|uniref:Uncharacterized protein n=1 Tax=Microvirga thermotolerans TaxID=2651334 RepID=A0A5P9JW50_9HYPH|nr:hypothetical protein [Microvirga thermotolerans]QFU16439.1 hypothetical protein GDR74_09475 [Microvirga thermotolerans]
MIGENEIRTQEDFEMSAQGDPSEENRRNWHREYRFADDCVVELTGKALELPRGLNSDRAKIILGAFVLGLTAKHFNENAKRIGEELGNRPDHDGDLWIAIKRGYARLKSSQKSDP